MKSRLDKARVGVEQVQNRRKEVVEDYQQANDKANELSENIGQLVVEGGDVQELTGKLMQYERERDVLQQAVQAVQREEAIAIGAVKELERQEAEKDFEARRKTISDKALKALKHAEAIEAIRIEIAEDNESLEAIGHQYLVDDNGQLEGSYKVKIRQSRNMVVNFSQGAKRVQDAAKALTDGA